MPKLFCVSDIHGFYDQFKEALDNSGFDKDNEDHWLIVCGDLLDRGQKPLELIEFIESLSRKILIRGNHEDLLEELCLRGFPYGYDRSNGTESTVCQLAKKLGFEFDNRYDDVHKRLKPLLDSMVDYFETKNYVFVHGWIPCAVSYKMSGRSYQPTDWRNANKAFWEEARWLNPFDVSKQVTVPDKRVICGHWHCSTGWSREYGLSELGKDARWEPYYTTDMIAIDRCTAYTGKVNIVVLEDDFIGRNEDTEQIKS